MARRYDQSPQPSHNPVAAWSLPISHSVPPPPSLLLCSRVKACMLALIKNVITLNCWCCIRVAGRSDSSVLATNERPTKFPTHLPVYHSLIHPQINLSIHLSLSPSPSFSPSLPPPSFPSTCPSMCPAAYHMSNYPPTYSHPLTCQSPHTFAPPFLSSFQSSQWVM